LREKRFQPGVGRRDGGNSILKLEEEQVCLVSVDEAFTERREAIRREVLEIVITLGQKKES